MTILVTGGAGFIGANFVLDWLATCDEPVLNLDKLTYAGNQNSHCFEPKKKLLRTECCCITTRAYPLR